MKVQVVFYSTYGHIYTMAEAVAEGAREVAGAEVSLFQVAELMPEEALEKSGAKAARAAFAHVPIITPDQLREADAIIFGTPTRFGNMCAQMRNFLDQTGQLWFQGGLIGKVGSVFASTASQHGGQEDHHHQLPLDLAAPRHDHRRLALLPTRPGQHVRDHRWDPLRSDHPGRRRRLETAQRERTGPRPLSRQARRRDRHKTRRSLSHLV